MSEGYIGLAPSYGVFQKQVIAGTTASTYDLDFDVVQSTQIMVSIDGIVQEPDWAFSIGRSSTGQMQITFAEALTVTTATGNTTLGSNSLTNVTTSGIVVGQGITGTGIPATLMYKPYQQLVHPVTEQSLFPIMPTLQEQELHFHSVQESS